MLNRPRRIPPKLAIQPVNRGSAGARALAARLSERLGYKVFRVGPDYIRPNHVVFKFREGTDKLSQFRSFHDHNVPTPEFTTDPAVARTWIRDNAAVVCRTLLRGSEGRGIVVAETEDQLVPAPLFTKYTKKKREFRVHIFNGQVIDVQEKRKRNGQDANDRDPRIRNADNGYVYCRENVHEPETLRTVALSAVAALGYFLGAVDIGFNERDNRCFVFEVNSTPGMEGTTLDSYATAIEGWYRSQTNAVQ